MRPLLLAFLLACTTQPDPAQPGAANPDAQRAKAAKMKSMKAAKAKAIRARLAKAKAKAGPGTPAAPAAKVGIAGPMTGSLVLTPGGTPQAQKTRAELALTWEGGEATALLGETAGGCEEAAPKEAADGAKATWWAACTYKDMTADFAIVVAPGNVLVQRAITKDGSQGEWITVRKVGLHEGAALTPGSGEPAKAKASSEAAPAPAPATPAPAPAEGGATDEAAPE